MTKETSTRLLALWIGGGFVASAAWEIAQMFLYAPMREPLRRCLRAALGDVVLLAILYAVMACAAADGRWYRDALVPRATALAALGLLVATLVELRALPLGEWSYSPAMSLVPWLNVGWSPVLQMILIPLGLVWLSRRFA